MDPEWDIFSISTWLRTAYCLSLKLWSQPNDRNAKSLQNHIWIILNIVLESWDSYGPENHKYVRKYLWHCNFPTFCRIFRRINRKLKDYILRRIIQELSPANWCRFCNTISNIFIPKTKHLIWCEFDLTGFPEMVDV